MLMPSLKALDLKHLDTCNQHLWTSPGRFHCDRVSSRSLNELAPCSDRMYNLFNSQRFTVVRNKLKEHSPEHGLGTSKIRDNLQSPKSNSENTPFGSSQSAELRVAKCLCDATPCAAGPRSSPLTCVASSTHVVFATADPYESRYKVCRRNL